MTDSQKIKKIEQLLEKWKKQVEYSQSVKHYEDQPFEDAANLAREEYIDDLDAILNPKPVDTFDPNQMTVFDFLNDLQMEQREQM